MVRRQLICLTVLIAIAFEGYSECQAQIVRRIIERRAAAREAAAEAARATDTQAAEAAPPAAATLRARIAARAAAREQQAADSAAPRFGQDPQRAGTEPEGPGSIAPPFTAQRPNNRPDLGTGVDQASAAFAMGVPVVPTERDLSALEIGGLARVLQDWNDQLAVDLESFTTSESWQRYLLLPEGLVDWGAIQPDGLSQLKNRFDKVAENPRFEQISSLPSFQATHLVLQRLGMEVNGPQLLDAAGAAVQSDSSQEQAVEVLPLPEASDQSPDSGGERSILLRD